MRVQGNINPNPVSVTDYRPNPGTAEIRLRENVVQIGDNLYEYDEYTAHLPDRDGLERDIRDNLADWLVTLRTLEIDQNASIVVAQQRDINAYEAALSEIEAALGVSV